jgi:hypothetical protein
MFHLAYLLQMADCDKCNVHRIDTVSTVPGTYKHLFYVHVTVRREKFPYNKSI